MNAIKAAKVNINNFSVQSRSLVANSLDFHKSVEAPTKPFKINKKYIETSPSIERPSRNSSRGRSRLAKPVCQTNIKSSFDNK